MNLIIEGLHVNISEGKTLSEKEASKMCGNEQNTSRYYNDKTGEWDLSEVNMFRGESISGGKGTGRGSLGDGLYVTPSRKIAQYYADGLSNGVVNQYSISKQAKIISLDKLFDLGFDDYVSKYNKNPESLIRQFALSKKIDGISSGGSDAEFVIFNTKIIKRVSE